MFRYLSANLQELVILLYYDTVAENTSIYLLTRKVFLTHFI